jgi:hypothetical protein
MSEALDRGDARDDEDRAHGDRADDSPEEHAVAAGGPGILQVGESRMKMKRLSTERARLEHVAEAARRLRASHPGPPSGRKQEAERDRQGDPRRTRRPPP